MILARQIYSCNRVPLDENIEIKSRWDIHARSIRIRGQQLRQTLDRRFDIVRVDKKPSHGRRAQRRGAARTLFAGTRRTDGAGTDTGGWNTWTVRRHAG